MDRLTRRALHNAAALVASLEPGEAISREDLIDALRQPDLPDDLRPSDAVIHHAYRHYVLRGGIGHAATIVDYSLAAELSGTSVEAVRQAAYRGRLEKQSVYRYGRERAGVTLQSLAGWQRWSPQQSEEFARRIAGDQ